MRTTRAELDGLVNIVNHALLCEPGTPCTALDPERAYEIEYAYGRPRLVRDRRSVDVSPRLPAGQLAMWLRAFIDGIEAGRRTPRPAIMDAVAALSDEQAAALLARLERHP